MEDELLDVVNEKDEVVGQERYSKFKNNTNLICRVGTVFVLNNKGQVVLARKKRNNSDNMWTIGCGGHIKAGEDPTVGTKRELKEELDLEGDIEFIKKHFYKSKTKSNFVYIYKLQVADDTKINFGDEYVEIKWADINNISNDIRLTPPALAAIKFLREYLLRKDEEYLDLVDENDNVIGTVLRSAAHKNPALIHREVVVGIFDSPGKILIQQRGAKKTTAFQWRISCAGHVNVGEDPRSSVQREVKEELGLDIDPVFAKKRFYEDTARGETKFYWIYYAIAHNTSFAVDHNEVNDAKWVGLEEIAPADAPGKTNVGPSSYDTIVELKHLQKLDICDNLDLNWKLNINTDDELLDLIDSEDNVIGTVSKSAAHKNHNYFYRAVSILLLNKNGQILLQQRSLNKSTLPGYWTGVGGHVHAKESPSDAIKREVKEEIGINVNPTFLTKIWDEGPAGKKLFWVFYDYIELSTKFTLDSKEVNQVQWIDLNNLEIFAENNLYSKDNITYKAVEVLKNNKKANDYQYAKLQINP